jgi:hypothetical protein
MCTQRVGGTPLPVDYTVNVTPAAFSPASALSFGYIVGTSLPAAQSLNVNSAAGAWTASASQPWITLSATTGNGGGQLMVGVNPQSLSQGNYSGSVTVSSASLGQQTVVVTFSVGVPVAGVSNPLLDFSGPNGSVFPQSTLQVTLSSGAVMPMTVTADKQWIVISSPTANGPGQFQVVADPVAGALIHGDYTGNIHIHLEGGVNDLDIDVPVHLALQLPTLSVSPAQVVLGGTTGRTFDPVAAVVSLNTGGNAYTWNVSTPPTWVTLDRSSGTAAPAGQTVMFNPQRSFVTPGTTTTTLTFTASVNGDTVTRAVPVSFNLDTQRLIAAEVGVGFVSTPSTTWRRLTDTIAVRSNFGEALAWTASSSVSWLSAVRTGNNVVLTANPHDPAVANADQLYEATVTLADPSGSAASEHIHVGLWVNSTTPTPYTKTPDFNSGGEFLGADPVRPYIYYVAPGGVIHRLNPYTQSEVLPQISTASLGATDLGGLAPSSDGQFLYVYDKTDLNNVRILRVDLTTLAPSVLTTTLARSPTTENTFVMNYARPNGVGMLLTNVGHSYHAESGADFPQGIPGLSAVSRDGSRVFFGNGGFLPDYTAANGGTFTLDNNGYVNIGNGVTLIGTATNLDGSAVYFALAGGSSAIQFYKYNGITFTPGATFPASGLLSNVAVDVYGRFIGTYMPTGSGDDFWVYGADDTLIHSMTVDLNGQIGRNRLVLTPDGCYAVAEGGVLYYVALGPP